MPPTIKRHLKVGAAPQVDEGFLMVRMHHEDLPKGIKWNNYIELSTNDAKITCKVRSNQMAEIAQPRNHQINVNRKLRGVMGIKIGLIYDFYVRKAPFWKAPYYVIKYHPDRKVRRNMVLKLIGVSIMVIAAVGGGAFYYAG